MARPISAWRQARRGVAGLLGCLAGASLAHAASFDCAKAGTPIEHAICADAALSKADSQLAGRYGDAMAQLSAEGKRVVRDGQRQWLGYVRALCGGKGAAGADQECQRAAYEARLRDLALAAVRVGPYLFSRIDDYAAANPDEQGVLSRGQIAVPRIDAPLTPVALQFNERMRVLYAGRSRSAGCDGPSGDYAFDYRIGGVTRASISIVTSDWMFCHGTAHGYGGDKTLVYVTEPRLHLLTADDLFRRDTDWAGFLAQRSALAILKSSGASELDVAALDAAVRSPAAWSLRAEGLELTINLPDIGAGPGIVRVDVTWAELRPFLNAAGAALA